MASKIIRVDKTNKVIRLRGSVVSTSNINDSVTSTSTTWSSSKIDSDKQDTLVSGTNIKTINNQSILGPGNLTVSGGGGISDGDKGDITVSGSGSVWTIDNNVVSNAKLAQIPTNRIKGRVSAGTGNVEDLTANQVRTLINVEDGAQVNTVDSVNGQTGAVVLDSDDIVQGSTNLYITLALRTLLESLETVSTDNAIVRFDGASGGTQNSSSTISDSGVLTTARATLNNSSTLADATRVGNATNQLLLYANNGGAEINTTNDTRIRFNNQIRFDSNNYDINTPPIVLRNVEEDDSAGSKGSIIEWQQNFTAGAKTVGISTQAYWDWIRGGSVGPRPTFTVGSTGAKRVGWMMCHYDSPVTTGEDIHQHMNFETAQADLSTIVTRLQISYGEDIALVSFPSANVQVFDNRKLYLSSNSDVYLSWNSTTSQLEFKSDNTKIGDNTTDVILQLAGQNGSATGATLQFSESSGTPKNGVSLVYDSQDNQLEIRNDNTGATTAILLRDGGLNMVNNRISNIGNPTSTQDAATKAYVDTEISNLGTAAAEDVGVLAGNVVQLDGSARLPAVDGSQLTNLPSGFTDPMTTRGDIIYRDATNTTDRLAAGTAGQVLTSDGTDISWQTPSGGGDVTGPASSTDNAIARFDSTTGKVIQNSSVTVDDSGNIATSGTVDGRDISVDGAKLDGIESGAQVNTVDSVNTQTGAVVLDADDIDDTSTTNKFVTASDITKLSNLSGTNTGDVTVTDSSEIDFTLTGQNLTASLIAGSIDETKLDTSVNASLDLADSSLQSSEIGSTVQAHSTILDNTTASYTTAEETKLSGIETGAEVNNISDANATDLTDGGDSTLHFHASDRNRANHTGTQTLSTISDAGTAASQNTGTGPNNIVQLDASSRLPAIDGSQLINLPSGSGDLLASNNLSDLDNITTARTNLGVAIGTDVQAYSANLDSFAGKTAPSGDVVGTTDSQTLTNKTIGTTNTITVTDNTFTIQDNLDNTKQAILELNGISPGNTRILTVPNQSGTIALTSDITGKQDNLSGLSLTSVTPAGDDKVLIQDTNDSNNLKTSTAENIAGTRKGYTFRAFISGSSGLSGTQKIPFNSESFDPEGDFDSVTNNRYVAPIAMYYSVAGQIRVSGTNSSTGLNVSFYKNGSLYQFGNSLVVSATKNGDEFTPLARCDVELAATDFLEVYTQLFAGTATRVAGSNSTFFSGFIIQKI